MLLHFLKRDSTILEYSESPVLAEVQVEYLWMQIPENLVWTMRLEQWRSLASHITGCSAE